MDRAQALRCLRVVLLLCLCFELFSSLSYPSQSSIQFRETVLPAWRHSTDEDYDPDYGDAPVCAVYASTLLLRRCQAAMQYNTSSRVFETPQLALWRSTDELLSSDPAAGWATWQELVMTAKHPWAVYWASRIVPDSWHVMPPSMRENLELLQAAVPLVMPPDEPASASGGRAAAKQYAASSSSSSSSGSVTGMDDADDDDDDDPSASFWVVRCSSQVNATTLRPVDLAECVVTVRGKEAHVGGSFLVEPGFPRQPSASASASPAAVRRGPIAKALLRLLALARRWQYVDATLHVLGLLAPYAVPTFGLGPLRALLQQLAVLELEFDLKVLVLYIIVMLVALRNWLYHVAVVYKVAARLGLLGFHRPLERLTGTVLTFIGVVLGLWQSVGFGVLDICLDALMARAVVLGLGYSSTVAWLLWQVSIHGGVFEGRLAIKAYSLVKQAWGDLKNLVVNPRVLLNQQAAGVITPLRQQVATVGSWPAPLSIPESIDDLSNAEVPRGFICPITQSIMRQPALLLHDRTIAPSTYDKEAITQWLSEHSSDPKNPGARLRMKSVKLVYNGDLARAIEDWVKDKLQAQADMVQQDQLRYIQQRLLAMRQQAQQRLAAVQQQQEADAAAAAGGALDETAAGPGPGPAVAAAAAAAAGANALPVVAAAALVADAGQLVREPSVTLARVASMDLPQVAAAGLASLTTATRRMTTRAAARRLREQQLREQQQQQDRRPGRRRQQHQHQQARASSSDDGLDSTEEDEHSSGGSDGADGDEIERHHEHAAAAVAADGDEEEEGGDDEDDTADSGSRPSSSRLTAGARRRRRSQQER